MGVAVIAAVARQGVEVGAIEPAVQHCGIVHRPASRAF
jgi:hypothetical protein